MIYIDENGAEITNYDLTKGYLVDGEHVDHPEISEKGHYEYEPLAGGGRLQKYIIDTPYQPAYREVTVQKYIRYTTEELELLAKADYAGRLDALESNVEQHDEAFKSYIDAYNEGVQNA